MKTVISSTAFLLLSYSVLGQKLDAARIPAPVKASFSKQFPGTPAKWEKEGARFEASFKKGTDQMSAVFEADGRFVESETEIPVSALPETVKEYMRTHYKSSIRGAARISTGNSTSYEAAIKGKDIIFDAQGHFLKEVQQ